MATLDYLDDWKLDFDFETIEPLKHDQDENYNLSLDDYLDALDTNNLTMH